MTFEGIPTTECVEATSDHPSLIVQSGFGTLSDIVRASFFHGYPTANPRCGIGCVCKPMTREVRYPFIGLNPVAAGVTAMEFHFSVGVDWRANHINWGGLDVTRSSGKPTFHSTSASARPSGPSGYQVRGRQFRFDPIIGGGLRGWRVKQEW